MQTTNKQALSALTSWIVEAMEFLPLSEQVKAGLDILLDLQKQPEQATLTAPTLDPSTTCIECFRRLCQCGECHHCLSFEASNLGRVVRNAWINRYQERENPNPAHLLPYNALDQWDKETDDIIGREVAEYVGAKIATSCHLCQIPTTTTCAGCHKPALDISLYAAIPPRNYAEAERYEHVSALVSHAVESLEAENQPIAIKAVHERLEQPATIEEVREIVREQYSGIEE